MQCPVRLAKIIVALGLLLGVKMSIQSSLCRRPASSTRRDKVPNQFRTICVAAFLMACTIPAKAVPITYTVTGIGTGCFSSVCPGDINFTDALITITAVGDTDHVILFNGVWVNSNIPISITVDGIGTGHETGFAFVDLTLPAAAGGIAGTSSAILGTISDSDFSSYDLKTAIGPITGFGGFSAIVQSTDFGEFLLQSVGQTTFTATINATPLPSALPLLGSVLGLGGVLGWRRKRARRYSSRLAHSGKSQPARFLSL